MSDEVATEPDDDVYDVCPDPTTVSGVSNIKAMFETGSNKLPIQADPKGGRPPVLSKPKVTRTEFGNMRKTDSPPPSVPAKAPPVVTKKDLTTPLKPVPGPPLKSEQAAKRPNYSLVTKPKPPPTPSKPAILSKSTASKDLPNGVEWPPPPPPELLLSDTAEKPVPPQETVVVGDRKFQKLAIPDANNNIPKKPTLPPAVDIDDLKVKHAGYEDEDFYDDVEPGAQLDGRATSEIPELTEADEKAQNVDEIYDDTIGEENPQEIYDDVC